MARRVLADFQAELVYRLANRSDVTPTNLSLWIDDAYRWTCLAFKHPEIEAAGPATQQPGSSQIIPAATDIWWVEIVKNSDIGRILDPGDKDVIEDRIIPTRVATEYYWWARVILTNGLAPTLTNHFLWYVKTVPELVDGQSPLIDRIFDQVIIMKAAEIGLASVRDLKESAATTTELDRYVSRWSLPKRENKKNMTGAGVRPRLK